jgi:hypothetical protein
MNRRQFLALPPLALAVPSLFEFSATPHAKIKEATRLHTSLSTEVDIPYQTVRIHGVTYIPQFSIKNILGNRPFFTWRLGERQPPRWLFNDFDCLDQKVFDALKGDVPHDINSCCVDYCRGGICGGSIQDTYRHAALKAYRTMAAALHSLDDALGVKESDHEWPIYKRAG